MKDNVKVGDIRTYKHKVVQADVAAFHGEVVHAVCSTFALARDCEWTTRQFVLDLREEDEEGIGTLVSIEHKSPAFVGEDVTFTARVEQWNGNELICTFEARVDDRLIAVGKTGQKILKREKIRKIFKEEGRS